MKRNKEYFSHDYAARSDIKMQRLFNKYGLRGIGAFWCIVEMLYEAGGKIELKDIDNISESLRCTDGMIRDIIVSENISLFQNDTVDFWSNSVMERMEMRQEVTDKRKKAAESRWSKDKPVKENKKETIIPAPMLEDVYRDPAVKENCGIVAFEKLEEALTSEIFQQQYCASRSADISDFKQFTRLWLDKKKLTGNYDYPLKRMKEYLMNDYEAHLQQQKKQKNGSSFSMGQQSPVKTAMQTNQLAKELLNIHRDGKH